MSTEILPPTESALSPARCHNCATPLQGNFCAHCGQADHPLDPRIHDLAHELMHEFLHLDGKILTSLKHLLFFPGRLSAEFFEGKRARSIGPVRLYLTMSLLFFLVLAHDTKPDRAEAKPNPQDVSLNFDGDADQNSLTKTGTDALKTAADAATLKKQQLWKHKIEDAIRKAVSDPQTFQHEMLSNCSHAMFLLVPLFALMLRIAYRNRRYHYPAYVYFSLHYHAFVFQLFSLMLLVGLLKIDALNTAFGWIVFLGVPLYLYLAMRRVFGGSRKRTLQRLVMLGTLYTPCLALGMLIALILTISFI
ncbi:MAG: DUF3667 domain-containing protein [Terracidiphilus sp.]|nr:DUF3667 domain-containing protein [Terracidiphilus sp.]